MLTELLRTCLARSTPAARQLGLVHEHAAIAGRHRRMRAAWRSHLEASRAAILEASAKCVRRQRALVIGAGDCLDVPVAELAAQFHAVVLADVVIGPVARRLARHLSGRVSAVLWDATGALAVLAAGRKTVPSAEARHLLEAAQPGPPPGGETDLVVSANCLSQLGLVPAHALAAADKDDGLRDRCASAAARVHLAWLAARPGVRVLLADTARLDIAPGGRVLKRENLLKTHGLRPPDRSWRWDLAPIPEHSREYHRVHEVGCWIDGPVE